MKKKLWGLIQRISCGGNFAPLWGFLKIIENCGNYRGSPQKRGPLLGNSKPQGFEKGSH